MNTLLTLTLGLLVSTVSAAEESFNHSAEFRLRFAFTDESDLVKDSGVKATEKWKQRFKFATNFKANDKLSAHLSLYHNTQWGASGVNQGTQPESVTDESGNKAVTEDHNLVVGEAYGNWMVSNALMIDLGRRSYQIGDGTVIAMNDFGNVPTFFEGGRLVYNSEFIDIGFLRSKIADMARTDTMGIASDPESNLYGLTADFKSLPDFIKMAHLHILQRNTDATDTTFGENQIRLGFTFGCQFAMVDCRIAYAQHSGHRRENLSANEAQHSGSMIDAEVGFGLPEVMNLRFYLLYHTDSGEGKGSEYTAYDSFYYDWHKNAGLMDLVGWGNLNYIKVGLSMEPTENIALMLDYYMFNRTETSARLIHGMRGSVLSGLDESTSTEAELGSELDFVIRKKYDDGFSISTRLGMFTPGAFLANNGVKSLKEAMTELVIEGKMTF